MKKLMAIGSILLASTFLSAHAHDLGGKKPAQAPIKWRPERLIYMPIDRAALALSPVAGQRFHPFFVIVLPNRWPQGGTVRVCFNGGDDALRARILTVANQWIPPTNLALNSGASAGRTCSDHDASEVRIGFSEPGYWSYIGNDGISPELVNNNLASMNFQGFDSSPPADPEFTGVVLHEWGHALGLHHEHQSPASGCDGEYDWPKLYAYYKVNYGWDQQMVDQNVKQLMADHSAYDWSQVDRDSIMVYASDPNFLKNGTASPCYFHANNALSQLDIMGIERAYPKQNVPQALDLQAKSLSILLQSGIPGEVRKALETQNTLVQEKLKSQ